MCVGFNFRNKIANLSKDLASEYGLTPALETDNSISSTPRDFVSSITLCSCIRLQLAGHKRIIRCPLSTKYLIRSNLKFKRVKGEFATMQTLMIESLTTVVSYAF